jgi:hypothetical protein
MQRRERWACPGGLHATLSICPGPRIQWPSSMALLVLARSTLTPLQCVPWISSYTNVHTDCTCDIINTRRTEMRRPRHEPRSRGTGRRSRQVACPGPGRVASRAVCQCPLDRSARSHRAAGSARARGPGRTSGGDVTRSGPVPRRAGTGAPRLCMLC